MIKIKLLILGRLLVAFILGILPIVIGLKNEWYVLPLVFINFVFQFGVAIFQMLPYFKMLK